MSNNVEHSKEIHCKNCEYVFSGNYCPRCGQKGNTHRITWHQIFHDIQHQVFHFDRGILYTLREMMFRPANVIREFLEGRRIKYFHPISYLLMGSAFSLFIMSKFNDKLIKIASLGMDPTMSKARQEMNTGIFHAVQNNYNLVLSVFIPLLAVCSWLVFRKHRYNYAEHLILHCYTIGHTAFMGVILTPLLLTFTDSYKIYMLGSMVSYLYVLWAMYGLFEQKTVFKTILRLLLYILALLGAYLLLIILVSVVMIILKLAFGINIIPMPK